ncbi:unnamed protein product [Ambrosiozyma monospora]|uniref:Unnamed protein product n=1 Tax=Ambrosiozyma monospora TaxID=43982 RepID=A0A9W7DHT9_AMBMO|nr:unnamed protein product [Ambrosiozyma monospora]
MRHDETKEDNNNPIHARFSQRITLINLAIKENNNSRLTNSNSKKKKNPRQLTTTVTQARENANHTIGDSK